MKKFYMTMVALLCGVAAMAQDGDCVYANDVKIDKGETTAELSVCLKNSVEAGAISFCLGLPDGVTVTLNKKGKMVITLNDDRAEDWKTDAQMTEAGLPQIAVFDSYPFDGNDGEIVAVSLTISEDVAAVDGEYDITLTNITVADPDAVSLTVQGLFPTEASCKLIVGEGTGIHSINADNNNAPVYNVAGQRVSKAQKGVYIQNGKKVAVK